MTTLIFNELYERYSSDIDGSIAKRVMDFIGKFQADPRSKGLDLKTPETARDNRIKSARVTDGYRAVLVELKRWESYTMVCVKKHDDAYDFASTLQLRVNETSGALEISDRAAVSAAVETVEAIADKATEAARSLFESLNVRARDLVRFDIPETVAAAVMHLRDEDALLGFVEVLPKNLQGILLDLASGNSLEEVWADYVPPLDEPVDTDDLAAAAQSAASRLMFTDGSSEETRAALEGSLARWRVWLHPSQRRFAEHVGWNGPARVTGGAGTGKTVTALHRAKFLAGRLAGEPSGVKALLTTYTRNLAAGVEDQLVQLAGPLVKDRVDVLNIDRLVYAIMTSQSETTRFLIGGGRDLDALVAAAIPDASWIDPTFALAEWEWVVLAQGLRSRDEYLTASRAGRGRRLNRMQRAQVWHVIEQLERLLEQQGKMTYIQAADRAAELLASGAYSAPTLYRHGVVDEAQDLHPAHWRLLRVLVPEGQDDLFLVGDAHQRIYGAVFRLSWYGINIVGRSKRLTVNYRTSREILAWCVSVTRGEPVDDLDGSDENLDGARSEFSGPAPVIAGYASEAEEFAGLVKQLRTWHDTGLAWSEMAVMARFSKTVDAAHDALIAAGIPANVVDNRSDERKLLDSVRVMTMHRGKGLEYRAVALVDVRDGVIPAPYITKKPDDEQTAALAREKNLLYVAGSRAMGYLSVSWSGKPSQLLAGQ